MLLRVLALFAIAALGSANAAPLKLEACKIRDTKVATRCGTLLVPENRAMPGGRMLPLHVVMIPARKPSGKAPVFYFSGGPGQAATDLAPQVPADYWQIADHDLVLMDLRGTGQGTKLDCALGGTDDAIETYLEPLFRDTRPVAACAAQLSRHADLSQYTTANAMQDIDALRAALGYDSIDIDSGSYGTRAAIVYMHMFPNRVRAAVLSGVVPMANRSPLYHAEAAERAIEALFAQCAADAGCHKTFPDPKADLGAILASLKAKPAPVTIKHPVTGKPATIALTQSAFASGLRVMLYDEHEGRRIPLLLHKARAGDFTPFAEAALENGRGLAKGLAIGMMLSFTCTEDTNRIDPREVAKETGDSFIGDARVKGQMDACSVWPKTKLPADYWTPFASKIPVLLISGNLDPVTPPHWGEAEHRLLANSLHVVMPGAHVAGNACVDSMSKQLYDTADIKAVDTSCAKAVKLPPWALH
ncbi:MAG TPA: alpha/beta fold hydrolase [Rhizomicrobium sp.]|jgi:pimeloyl-ACP methyl ester carboxylesterase